MKFVVMSCIAILLLEAGLCVAQSASGSTSAGSTEAAGAVQRALALEQQGKFPEAQAAWEIVVKSQPRNGLAFAHLGLLEARQEHYPEAIVSYRKARSLDPMIPQLNLNLGLALFKSGDFENAAKVFETELGRHPQIAEAQRLTILAGMSHYGAHAYAAAIPYLKEAAANDQRNLPLRFTLGHCYLWTKQRAAAMAVYKEILTIDPDSAEADMIAGEALDEKGDKSGAEKQFEAAEKINPKEPNVHFGVAYLRWGEKRFDEAVPEFKAELENDPNNYEAMIYLGDAYVQQNQLDLGKEMLEKAAKVEGGVPLIHLDLGIVYMEAGDKDAAVRELTKAVAVEPDNVTAHFRLAKVYQSMGKRDEAKAEFAKANLLTKTKDDAVHKRIAAVNARPDGNEKPDADAKPEKP